MKGWMDGRTEECRDGDERMDEWTDEWKMYGWIGQRLRGILMALVAQGSAASHPAALPCVTGKGQECAIFMKFGAFLSFPLALEPFWQPSAKAGTLAHGARVPVL